LLTEHGLLKLPGEDTLDGNGFDFFSNALFFEETVECGAAVAFCGFASFFCFT